MQAYEFSSVIEKDGIIHIPRHYLPDISSSVKVILLIDEKTEKKNRKQFSAMGLETKGFKFNREEANE
jgi:hypothetical protein